MNDGGLMNHLISRKVQSSSASATTWPSTRAVTAYFQMLRLVSKIEASS